MSEVLEVASERIQIAAIRQSKLKFLLGDQKKLSEMRNQFTLFAWELPEEFLSKKEGYE